jgi:hypothetical protein
MKLGLYDRILLKYSFALEKHIRKFNAAFCLMSGPNDKNCVKTVYVSSSSREFLYRLSPYQVLKED